MEKTGSERRNSETAYFKRIWGTQFQREGRQAVMRKVHWRLETRKKTLGMMIRGTHPNHQA